MGYEVVAYNRQYPGQVLPEAEEFRGVRLKAFSTTARKGFDTLWHSLRVTLDILLRDTADVVHIQNGGNSPFAWLLRLSGRRVYLSQDGIDWKRDKWPWYAKFYLWITSFITAVGPTKVIFDNVFARRQFQERFPFARERFEFIPFGSEPGVDGAPTRVLSELGLARGEYFLFVGRFIPDKGLQYLIPAFERVKTDKRLVLVGGSPNPGEFERGLRATRDPRILFAGYHYGQEARDLMEGAFAYIQPSDVEGLSPVILQNMGLGTPVICSDIEENRFVVGETATTFRKGDVEDLARVLTRALEDPEGLRILAEQARLRAEAEFSWKSVAEAHHRVFQD